MGRIRLLCLCLAVVVMTSGAVSAQHKPQPKKKTAHAAPPKNTFACGDAIGYEVLLDRHGFSPGEIDATIGTNAAHALAAFQATHELAVTGVPDCPTWEALGGGATQTITTYRVTAEDVKGPFAKTIPADLEKQASLPALSYRSPLEQLAERFHVEPALLSRLNHGEGLVAGRTIKVPAVNPFDESKKPAHDPSAADVTVQVTKEDSAARALGPDGAVIFYAPVTSGSEHDPLPLGNWKVTGVDWMPLFHYNPELFWDADPSHSKATIKRGPNNPVGVVWIALNLEHYGLHGTPDPNLVGHAQSHGCVRLTNWDAARLASLVKPGTPVVFR